MKKTLLLLIGLISLTAFAQQTYYDDVNLTLTGTQLRDALGVKVANTHSNSLSYSEIWTATMVTDLDPNNSNNVLLIYGWENGSDGDVTNDLSRSKNSNGGSVGDWNREHTFANSLANPSLDQFGTNGPPYSDAHNLRSSDVQRNGQRGNRKFAAGSGNSGTVGAFWYPGDASVGGTDWRGDVARIVMYMYIRYGMQCYPTLVADGTVNSVDSNMIDLLLEWNAADPVSTYEDARNTFHENVSNATAQGNRNPFIDNPRLASRIWGGTQAEDRWGIYGTDTQDPTVPMSVVVSNETGSSIDVSWAASTDDIGVTGYDVYVDGVFDQTVSTTTATVTGLSPLTMYTFTVLAKDAAGNTSAQSTGVDGTTTAAAPVGTECENETFENIGANSGQYLTRSWTGDNTLTWEATDARTDQVITNGKAITVRNGAITAPTVPNGIGELTVTTQLVFSGSAGTFDLRVNNVYVATIPYSSTVTTTTIPDINVDGNISVVINNNSTGSNRVRFDDLSWTCYSPPLNIEDEEVAVFSIYPNPTNGGIVYIKSNNATEISEARIYDITGKQVLQQANPTNEINVQGLQRGLYILQLQIGNQIINKKLIKQ
ncbi:Extracellular ribonuclease [Kordia antarctica]|uniref:Extracellular ribonuclease n=1 Tax=Kordia antarctica TaxID=1218801 RepID=A0A7L4ZQ55_9FLAO|nr:endonuclease [Kordia antarctica]QHI38873.1 Extracellular ribonuclease [Kordia antarctica]